jgi:hypothetical protein
METEFLSETLVKRSLAGRERQRVPDGSSECCHFEKTKDTTDY